MTIPPFLIHAITWPQRAGEPVPAEFLDACPTLWAIRCLSKHEWRRVYDLALVGEITGEQAKEVLAALYAEAHWSVQPTIDSIAQVLMHPEYKRQKEVKFRRVIVPSGCARPATLDPRGEP